MSRPERRQIHLHVFCGDNLDSDNIGFRQQWQHTCCEITSAFQILRGQISTSRKQTVTATYQSPSALAETSAGPAARWSVVSGSARPHGLQPARPLCPWDPPGEILGRAAMPASRRSSWSRDRTCVSHTAGTFFPSWASRDARPKDGTANKAVSQLSGAVPELRPLGGEQCGQIRAWALGTKHPGGSPHPATYRASRASVSPSVKWG